MKLLERIPDLAELRGPLALAIGVFDGVHIGHQAVIRHAMEQASEFGGEAVVVSFKPHPQRILQPDVAPRLLTSTPHKTRILQRLGVANLLLVPFTREFSQLPPQEFIDGLVGAANGLHSVSVGQAWAFGRNRVGNLAMLAELGKAKGFSVTGVSEIAYRGEPVSSTRIRKFVETGNLAEAEAMLGRPLSLFGTVVKGRELGRTIGFPTANISIQNEQLPLPGVYAANVSIHPDDPMPAVVNLGKRPTVESGRGDLLLEAHILDFNANLYGLEIEVEILGFLRPEEKFESVDALKAQIAKDIEAADVLRKAAPIPRIN